MILAYHNTVAIIILLYSLDTFSPTITEATFQTLPNNMGLLYECEAIGSPLPDLRWSAVNINIDSRERLENSFTGITINEEEEIDRVRGQLTISVEANFSNPRCIAENEIGQVNENNFILQSATTMVIGK